jgi:hypothetical protein
VLKRDEAEVIMLKRSVLWVALVLGAATGCSDKAFDCNDICTTLDACTVADIDVGACRDRCEDFADNSTANGNLVEACNDCLDTRACGLAPQCTDLCAFLID